MAERIYECPSCRGPFRVPADQNDQRMRCPHCREVVDLTKLPPVTADATTEVVEKKPSLDPELDKLLPPKFLIPSLIAQAAANENQSQIVLPDPNAGFRLVDTSRRTVEYRGKQISIKALSSRSKRRRRTIRTIALATMCAAILLVVFRMLMR
jgi:DNA-directed RNA polymerase subunit RPC12/RpoP